VSRRRFHATTGQTTESIAKATGLTPERVNAVLIDSDSVTVSERVKVGGLLGVPMKEQFA
jgi:hypothetical protein